MIAHVSAVPPAARALLGAGYPRPRTDTTEVLIWLVVAAVGIAAVCGVVYAGTRLAHRWRHNSHLGLVFALSRLHGLDRRARALVRQVAGHHNLPHPARVFTEPKWLDPAALKGPLRARAAEIKALRNRLFGEAHG